MNTILTILAVAGIGAAVWHVARAAFRLLRHEVTGFWADEVARTHARRGDVTALEETKRERERVLQARRRVGAEAVGWLALLVAPSFTPWAGAIYAGYALFWLLPVLRWRAA